MGAYITLYVSIFFLFYTMTQTADKSKQTPTLYTYYGKQYDFDNLKRDADLGFGDYLQSLKRGNNDQQEFWDAYSNMMKGIGDGSIVFDNGRFTDSKGRYSNGIYYDSQGNKQSSKKKSKDYYGLVANYIAGKLGKQSEYQDQKEADKLKWDSNAPGTALIKGVFNTTSPNIQYFMDLDPYNENTQSRGTSARTKVIKNWIDSNINEQFFDKYKGYSDQDKIQLLEAAKQASKALEDGTIDSGDYFTLSKAFPNIPWDQMFTKAVQSETDSNNNEQPTQVQDQERDLSRKAFVKFLDQNYSRKGNDSLSFPIATSDFKKYGTWTADQIKFSIKNADDNTLLNYLGTAINNPNREFGHDQLFTNANGVHIPSQIVGQLIISKLIHDGKLVQDQQNANIYYIPNMFDRNTNSGYYYDNSTKTIYKKSVRDIPYWQNVLWKQFSGDTSESWIDKFYTTAEYQKNGGVLKAQDGTKMWYSKLQDYDPSKYKYSYDTSKLVNGDMSDDSLDPWVSNISGAGVGRYKPSQGNTKEYAQTIENQDYYKAFGNSLFNPDGSFTDTGIAWAKAVDANLPKGSTASFYDDNGNLRTSWTVKNQDIYGRGPRTFNNLRDYVNYVRNDQILGARHNVFLNQGNRYFYLDKNNEKHWVDPEQISDYVVSENPVQSGWNDDKTIYWNDYQLSGIKPGLDNSQSSNNKTHVNPIIERQKQQQFLNTLGKAMYDVSPEILGTQRLIESLRANNKIQDILDESLRPVLKDTYERYSPVTGAFSEMQFRNNQASNLRRQVSRPFTSDSSLQLAGKLDADKQARDIEYQGFLADDKEIKRTKAEALARQEDNMARRSETANFNRASINQANREKSQLEAARLRRNWQSKDNFLQGIEGRLRNYIQEKNNTQQQVALSQLQNQYEESVYNLNNLFKEQYPNSTTQDMLSSKGYIQGIKDLQSWLKNKQNQLILNPYSISISNKVLKSPEEILRNIKFKKNGGNLKPSIDYLINKIIQNENNT